MKKQKILLQFIVFKVERVLDSVTILEVRAETIYTAKFMIINSIQRGKKKGLSPIAYSYTVLYLFENFRTKQRKISFNC